MGKKKRSAGLKKYNAEYFAKRITMYLKDAEGRAIEKKKLAQICGAEKNRNSFSQAIDELTQNGKITKRKKGYVLCRYYGYFTAHITRLQKTFGFAEDKNGLEIFIPGKFLLGSLVGDRVLMRFIDSRSGDPEGEVLDILEFKNAAVEGTIVLEHGKKMLLSSRICSEPLKIIDRESCDYRVGDKVLALVVSRGSRHSDHRVAVTFSYGTSRQAANCARAYIDANEIPVDFPNDVVDEARAVSSKPLSLQGRLDLRDRVIFTIDSEHSKDLDDAVSLSCDDSGYELGVHIADVSNYVKQGSPLDVEAFERGTSIYYADKVIPMLPVELSNGICSLNGGEDRYALSCLMHLDREGELVSYKFAKTVIRSRVKGVYSEINSILDNRADEAVKEKYKAVLPTIKLLDKLCDLRLAIRKKRGTPEIDTVESGFITDEKGICIGLYPRQRGRSERIIEEMMLLANESAARFAADKDLPFVYRVHDEPTPEKITALKDYLLRLHVKAPKFDDKVSPGILAGILDKTREESFAPVLNTIVLRSMSKAQYSDSESGHFGLALRDYAHFTSPIRRYADLAVHRIISAYIEGEMSENRRKKLTRFASHAARTATDTELRAISAERSCEKYYAAEYMSSRIGSEFNAVISGVTSYGIYVRLENSAEGLVSFDLLPHGEYAIDEGFELTEILSGKIYRIGDSLRVRCIKAEVESGNIDFDIA